MAIFDFTPPEEGPRSKPELVVSAKASSSGSPWMHELTVSKVGDKSKAEPPAERISGGALANMSMPPGWTAGESNYLPGHHSYQEFLPKDASDDRTRIQIVDRERSIPSQEQQALNRIFAAGDHRLTRGEQLALGSILGNKQDSSDFRIDRAWTQGLNGKQVLMVEGEFTGNHVKNLSMIVDKDGAGTQEISYLAPVDDFNASRPAAERSFNSIKWK